MFANLSRLLVRVAFVLNESEAWDQAADLEDRALNGPRRSPFSPPTAQDIARDKHVRRQINEAWRLDPFAAADEAGPLLRGDEMPRTI